MRSKKNGSMRKRKYGNKKSNKSKKCGCGVKLPFLKWGGDNPNGPTNNNNNTDLSGKFNSLLTNINGAYDNATNKINSDFKDLKYSAQGVIDDTGNHITTTTKGIVDDAKKNTSDLTSKTNGFFTDVYKNAKDTLDKVTNKVGSFPSTPKKDIPTTSSLSSSSDRNSSNKTTSSIANSGQSTRSNSDKYTNAIKERRALLNSNGNGNSGKQQGGKRRSSKKHRSRKNVKSKKTKRRRHIYKHKGGSGHMDGPLGIEKSSLAFTGSPISNIKAVAPTADQMYGQTPYPAWRFSN